MHYTIQKSEIERLKKQLDWQSETFDVDIVELNEVDQHGDNFGLSFKANHSYDFKYENGDYLTPPSAELKNEDFEITEIKVINAYGDEIEITSENYKSLESELIELLKYL